MGFLKNNNLKTDLNAVQRFLKRHFYLNNICTYYIYMNIKLAINGLGRIGKCLLLQSIDDPSISICAINAVHLKVDEIEDYINYDTVHGNNRKYDVQIVDERHIKIGRHYIVLNRERDRSKIDWGGCEYLIDATGSSLTTNLCLQYGVPYVIISAPAQDETPSFIYGANHTDYKGENVVSSSSCTSNCLAPVIRRLSDNYTLDKCCFTTIHSVTASQNIVDSGSTRIRRSGMNIIPHSTGASREIVKIFPELSGRVWGQSVRVPTLNVSLLDLHIEVANDNITVEDVSALFTDLSSPFNGEVFAVNTRPLVSGDFCGTTAPAILDLESSLTTGKGSVKLMLWYDNEWSYSAQVIRLLKHMSGTNCNL